MNHDPVVARKCAVLATEITKTSLERSRELRAAGLHARAKGARQAAHRWARIAASWSLAALLTGCAGLRSLVTARVEIQSGTNRVAVVQPKDTTIESLQVDPRTGVLTLHGYASAANAEAIAAARAQAEAQAKVIGGAFDMVRELSAAFMRGNGLPVPAAPVPASQWTNPVAIPPGFKLVPKDDPSRPRPEIEEAR